MLNYRRAFVAGGCWFFTVNLLRRRTTLLTDEIAVLREAVQVTRKKYPFDIDAMVILPDHLHAVWTLPSGDADFSIRWRLISDWPHSSFHRDVRAGIFVRDWAGDVEAVGEFGE